MFLYKELEGFEHGWQPFKKPSIALLVSVLHLDSKPLFAAEANQSPVLGFHLQSDDVITTIPSDFQGRTSPGPCHCPQSHPPRLPGLQIQAHPLLQPKGKIHM